MKSKLTNIFQMGWFNHRLDIPFFFPTCPHLVVEPWASPYPHHFLVGKSSTSDQVWSAMVQADKGPAREKCVANVASLLMQVNDFEW